MRVARETLATPGWKVAAGDVDSPFHPPSTERAKAAASFPYRRRLRSAPLCLWHNRFLSSRKTRDLRCAKVSRTGLRGSSASRASQLPTCPSGEERALALSNLFFRARNIVLMRSQSQHKTDEEGSAVSPRNPQIAPTCLFWLEIQGPENSDDPFGISEKITNPKGPISASPSEGSATPSCLGGQRPPRVSPTWIPPRVSCDAVFSGGVGR